MRVFLIGSKELSCLVLDHLSTQGHQVLGVYTRDNDPSMKTWLNLGHRNLKRKRKRKVFLFIKT
jgi:methionyl-tRNA formyltransferase